MDDYKIDYKLEGIEKLLQQIIKDNNHIVYNYYNCSFNYGDHGYARNENKKEERRGK